MGSKHADVAVGSLVRNLHMVAALVQRLLVEEPLGCSVGDRLSFTQLNLLKLVGSRSPDGSGGGRRPWLVSQVARSLGVSAAAASQSISHLQGDGWLTVKPDSRDARRRRVTLTAKARRAIDSFERAKRLLVDELLDGARPADIARWTTALQALLERLLQATDEPPCLRCGTYSEGGCIASEHGVQCPVRRLSG